MIQFSNCPKCSLTLFIDFDKLIGYVGYINIVHTLFEHAAKMVWFKLFANIVDRSQFLTRRIALKVHSADTDQRGTDKYSFKSLCSQGKHSFEPLILFKTSRIVQIFAKFNTVAIFLL